MELMCVREFAEKMIMTVEGVEFKTVAFLDLLLPFFSEIIALFPLLAKKFKLISLEKI